MTMISKHRMRLPGVFFALVTLTLSSFVETAAGESFDESHDRFRLFDDCRPMDLVVEGLPSDALEIGLTRESVQVAAESRLRSARLYDAEGIAWLYINVSVVGRGFSIGVHYKKRVFDLSSGIVLSAPTWLIEGVGTHGGDPNYILSLIPQYMDRFLVEFLRVNEDACEKRFASPS